MQPLGKFESLKVQNGFADSQKGACKVGWAMLDNKKVLSVLLVGDDADVITWFKKQAKQDRLPWKIRSCDSLRVQAPESQLGAQDLVVVVWDKKPPVTLKEVLDRVSPAFRSMEGVLMEIQKYGHESLLRRVVILGKTITREDTFLFGECGIRTVIPLNSKPSQWDKDWLEIPKKCQKLWEEERVHMERPDEQIVTRFENALTVWERTSDTTRMELSEKLLKALGDSARYCDLMGRRSLLEREVRTAEQWFRKAIDKNPNFLKAMNHLADLLFQEGRYAEALQYLEKLRAHNPRNVDRLTLMARCHVALKEIGKADAVLENALSIDEFHAVARDEMGKVKCLLGEYEQARKLLSSSLNARSIAVFLNGIGVRLVEEKKFAESIEHYKRAQFVIPGNDQTHLLFFNIGLAYAKWGKMREASDYCRLALAREPKYEKAQSLLKHIETKMTSPVAHGLASTHAHAS